MTPEQVRELIREETQRPQIDPGFVQWLVRAAFESGWRAGGGSEDRSDSSQEPVGWRLAWMQSEQRAILVRQGFISGEDVWR